MNRLRETKNTELKVKPEDFYAHLNIKHWSGCWGGTIIQEAVPDLRKYLEKLSTEAKWISEFLKNSEPTQLRLERVVGTENGRHEKLAGQEYILKARLQNPERDLTNCAIVACIDGKPAIGMPEYTHLTFGKGLFQGYKLELGKHRYTLSFPYTSLAEACLDHTSFSDNDTKTIIGVHLFFGEQQILRDSDLSNIKPLATRMLVFDPNYRNKRVRRRK